MKVFFFLEIQFYFLSELLYNFIEVKMTLSEFINKYINIKVDFDIETNIEI